MKPRIFAVWGCLLLLSACGAERDEPFDPGTDEDTDEETAERLSVSRILRGEQTLLAIDGQKQTHVFSNEDDYFLFLDRYSDTLPANEPDFETGQVILVDLGEREDSNCDYHLDLNSITAEVIDDDTGLVTLNFSAPTVDTSDACPLEDPSTHRPWYFYFVETRRSLLIEESLAD